MPGPFDKDNALLSTGRDIPLQTSDVPGLLPLAPDPVFIGPDNTTRPNAREVTLPASATSSITTAPTANRLFDASVLKALEQLPKIDGLTSPLGPYDLGGGYALDFDADTLAGRVQPALVPALMNALEAVDGLGNEIVYTGSDCRIMIDCDHIDQNDRLQTFRKQLVEATTLSISIHRVKTPARAFGYINPKGVARGTRTCAGTLICTQGTQEVLYRFLRAMQDDLSKDTIYSKIDQLPPFNLTLFFSDEFGHASFQRILGVEFVTDGVVRSINDMITEQTITWIAADVTPLLPLTVSSLAQAGMDARVKYEKTVADAMAQKKARTAALTTRKLNKLPSNITSKINTGSLMPPLEVSTLPDQLEV